VGVDMARFKSEFLADYWRRHGTPLRARLLGNIDRLSVWGSRLAPLSNLAPRWLTGKLLHVDRRRSLPAWQRATFARWVAAHHAQAAAGVPVTLFNDTFTNHYDPEIGVAAVTVLRRAGCAFRGVRPGCCGRPLISQGLLAEARRHAAQVVAGLLPIASRGEKILFCEPSCLSAVKEDAPSLLRGQEQQNARAVADACQLFDEYAANLDLPLKPAAGRILLHGHCHQKSMGLLGATVKLLSKIPQAAVVDLDAGCCGMAGSFGYHRDHFDVSKTMAERRLLPAARSLQPGDVLVAPGTSCRHQVSDFVKVKAVHPAVLVRDLLP